MAATPDQIASFEKNEPSFSSATLAPPPETQTQIANRLFRQQAQRVPDAQVIMRASENEWEPIYRVEVPALRSKAFDSIVRLRSRLYRNYPNATINIEFRGRRELEEAENNLRSARP